MSVMISNMESSTGDDQKLRDCSTFRDLVMGVSSRISPVADAL